MRWLKVRWRWFRLEFNRRAHDRVYWQEPLSEVIHDRTNHALYAHPATMRRIKANFPTVPEPTCLGSLYGIQLYEAPWLTERKWKWVRR